LRYEFCTLFDSNYLPRGLVLYRSLVEHCPEFVLRVYCFDRETARVLDELNLPGLRVVPLEDLESHDEGLLAVKPTRAPVEYCWTSTPAVCLHALETEPEVSSITYLDADLMFFSSPKPVFEELGDASVLIVPHRYAPEYRKFEEESGTFNVEWLTFRRDSNGLEALSWWRERCLEWCYHRYEDGKMGDQKYLDDWPVRFAGVHSLQHPGAGLAPWNIGQYELAERDGRVTVDGRELIFYHYHSLRIYEQALLPRAVASLAGEPRPGPGVLWTTSYPASPVERALIWEPYLSRLLEELGRARRVSPRLGGGLGRWSVRAHVTPRGVALFAFHLGQRWLDRLRELDPWALRRYRESWQSEAVARQMVRLTEQQLAAPEEVAPYRAFLTAIQNLQEHDQLPEPARLLDVGCGAGAYADLVDRYFPGRFEYTGADYSDEILAAARQRAPSRRFERLDILADGVPPGYHVVLASALIDVIADWEPALDCLLAAGAPYVLLHRQRITDGPSRVEVARGYRGQHTYRTFLNVGDIERIAGRHHRRIADRVGVEGDISSFLVAREEPS
jgi:SAM-dependent methyltransferase